MSNQAQFGRNKYHQSRLRVVSRDEVTQPAVLDLPTEDADKVTEAVEPVVDAEVETVVDADNTKKVETSKSASSRSEGGNE